MKSFQRILRKNLPALVALLVSAGAGLGVFSLSRMISAKAENEAVSDFVRRRFTVIKGMSLRVEYLIEGTGEELQHLSRLKGIRDLGLVRASRDLEVSYEAMKDHVSSLRRLDGYGDLVLGYHGDVERIETAPNEGDRGYFQSAARQRRAVVSEVFVNGDGRKRVQIAFPVFRVTDAGEEVFDGVIAAAVDVDALYALISAPSGMSGDERPNFICYDAKGRVVMFPYHRRLDDADLGRGESACERCHTSARPLLPLGRASQGLTFIDQFDGRKMVAIYSPIRLADQVWVIGVYEAYDDVVKGARDISRYINLAAALSCLIVVIASYISFSVVRVRKEAKQREREIEREHALLHRIQRSEEQYRTLFDGVRSGVYISTPEGRFTAVNDAMVKILGYTGKEELQGIDIATRLFADPRDRVKFAEEIERNGFVKDLESRLLKRDGGEVVCLETAYGRRNDAGQIVEYLGILVDITGRKQMEREIREKNHELNTLHEVSKVITRSLVLDEILDLSVEKTLEATPFDAATIYLYDERAQTLTLGTSSGIPKEVLERFRTVRLGETLTGEIARDKEVILLDSLATDPRSIAGRDGLDFRSYVGLPLLYGERVMGVMNLSSCRTLSREECRLDLLKGVGELVGVAISNAQLYLDSQLRGVEMKVLYESGKSFMGITEIGLLARKVVEVANAGLGYEACSLLLLDPAKKELSIVDASYLEKGEKRRGSFRVGVDGVVGWVAENREACYLPDVTGDPRYLPGWLERGAELALPLMVGEEVLGVIDFEREGSNGFTPEAIRYLSLFSNQVAWALYNVRLFEEIKRANEDLNRASELKSQFVSLVSHELRTPMTAIKGSLDIIHSGAAGLVHEKQKMFISMARRNIDRLNDMVNNILDLSRIEAGKIAFEFRETDIREPLEHVLTTLATSADERAVTLQRRLPAELPTLYADEPKIEQILTNLIGNALKHTPTGGKVTVVAGLANEADVARVAGRRNDTDVSPNRFLKVSVSDTGSGIPADQLEAIFDRFTQLNGAKGQRGTGLGLSICRYLVEGHGGAIWAERGIPSGSVLSFVLPIFEAGKGTAN